ncbi:hypothetical protein ACFL1H_00020 [Nanoarchaeota archaeon]
MRVKRGIKKVLALGAAVTMVGASILGAMAYDLNDYPEPFVKDGQFDAWIVVGTNSISADTLGAVDLAVGLQYETKVCTDIAGSAPTIDEGVLIDAPGEDFNYGEEIEDIDSTLTSDDLDLLMDGEYDDTEGNNDNEEEYTQEIAFTNLNADLLFAADSEDDNEPTATYIQINDDVSLYTFTLDMDDEIDYDGTSATTAADDLEGTKIMIQGQDYTITDIEVDATFDDVTKITLMAGDTVMWMTQGSPITKIISGVEHEVELIDVADDEEACGVSVDGTTKWIDLDQTATINGVEVGVTDAIAVHSATQDTDACEVNLGAMEIILETGEDAKVGGSTIEGAAVTITGTGNNDDWDGFNVVYTPEDDIFVPIGGEWIDPVFGQWKIDFDSISQTTEEMDMKASSDDGELTLLNNRGDELEIPFINDGTNVFPGDEVLAASTLRWVVQDGIAAVGVTANGNLMIADGDGCYGSKGAAVVAVAADLETACEDTLLLVVGSGGEARIIEITDLDATADEIDLKDLTTGKTWDDQDYTAVVDLGFADLTITEALGDYDGNADANDIRLTFDMNDGYVGDEANADFETSKAGEIDIEIQGTETNVGFFDDNGGDLGVWTFDDDGSNDMEIEKDVGGVDDVTTSPTEEDSDIEIGLDNNNWGAIFTWDSDNKDDVSVVYPEEETVANVFIAPVSAIKSGGSSGQSCTIQMIDVGSAKFAKDAGNLGDQNMILVGGPCANELSDDFMGNPAVCTEGFVTGEALVKMKAYGSKVAMLVAGANGDDTMRAARVVRMKSKLSSLPEGTTEVKVSGTTIDNAVVTVP